MKMKTVSLVLGSGGARGYAHIGVIEELLNLRYQIDSISGSSMGALIGGLYACGKMEEYKQWVTSLSKFDIFKLLDITFNSSGFIKGEKIFKNLGNLLGKRDIESLPVKFTAVATDLTSKKEIWFQKGDLATAIRASVSIPTILTPKKIKGHFFVDGGILNPLPVAPTISDRTELKICVNLNADIPNIYKDRNIQKQEKKKNNIFSYFENKVSKDKNKKEKLGYFQIMQTSLNLMQNALSRYKTAEYSPDIMINIPIEIGDFYEFYRAKEFIEVGKRATEKALSEKFGTSHYSV
jgi:NTE family protein